MRAVPVYPWIRYRASTLSKTPKEEERSGPRERETVTDRRRVRERDRETERVRDRYTYIERHTERLTQLLSGKNKTGASYSRNIKCSDENVLNLSYCRSDIVLSSGILLSLLLLKKTQISKFSNKYKSINVPKLLQHIFMLSLPTTCTSCSA